MKDLLTRGSEIIKTLLFLHEEEINSAFLKEEDGGVSIGLKLSIEPGKSIWQKKLTARINFVESRVKDEFVQVIDENQHMLPFGLEEKKTA